MRINVRLFLAHEVTLAAACLAKMSEERSGAIFIYGDSMRCDQSAVIGSLHIVIPKGLLVPEGLTGRRLANLMVTSVKDNTQIVALTDDFRIEKALEELHSLLEVECVAGAPFATSTSLSPPQA